MICSFDTFQSADQHKLSFNFNRKPINPLFSRTQWYYTWIPFSIHYSGVEAGYSSVGTRFFYKKLGSETSTQFFCKEFGSETSTQFLMKTAFLSNELSFKEKLLFSFLILTVRSLHFFTRNLGP